MTTTLRSPSGRARPLPPAERRAHIIEAVLPLLREHGANVTTRQIAAAAGVAEGTLFRVFADKDAIIDASIAHVLDPGPWVDSLTEIPRDQPMEAKLRAAAGILVDRIGDVIGIMMVIGRTSPARMDPHRRPPNDGDPIMQAVRDLLAPEAAEFSIDTDEVARILRLLIFAGTHPWITDNKPLTSDEIVGLILDGVRARPGRSRTAHPGRR